MTHATVSLTPFASEALLRVVRLLETLPDRKFDLSRWHHDAGCGTTYCAMGFAAAQPWFQEQGLSLTEQGGIRLKRPNGAVCTDFTAVSQFFGISLDQAKFLFIPNPPIYSTRQQVISRIRKFVARNGEIGEMYEVFNTILTATEQAHIDGQMAALDGKLTLEKEAETETLMRKILSKGDQLVPDAV